MYSWLVEMDKLTDIKEINNYLFEFNHNRLQQQTKIFFLSWQRFLVFALPIIQAKVINPKFVTQLLAPLF